MTGTAYGLDSPRSDWRERARCSPQTAEWFWLTGTALSADNYAALELCADCPVRQPCLEYESSQPSRYSRIAGGMVITAEGKTRQAPTCAARKHGTKWAYERGCRCPGTVALVRTLWRSRARSLPRGGRGRSSYHVTIREREDAVARLSAAGLCARDIAVQLRVAQRTVQRIRTRLRGAA